MISILLVVGQLHASAALIQHEIANPKVCRAVAHSLKQWPQVKAAVCFDEQRS